MNHRKWRSFLVLICLGVLIIPLPGNSHLINSDIYLQQLSSQNLHQKAKLITVIILSGNDALGSGIIIKKQNSSYIIITNAHVIRAGNSPYFIQTFDGVIHPAKIVKKKLGKNDLGVLAFVSENREYTIAKLGFSLTLKPKETVYAVGYPNQSNDLPKFTVKTGEIVGILAKPLEGGYQVGCTNEVYKGMSGGALLNRYGEVVGINGRHAYPLWDAPEYYQDGSQPNSSLKTMITDSSWAIPVEKIDK